MIVSLTILIAVNIDYIDDWTSPTDSRANVRLAKPVLIQQFLLCYSLISATIPNLRAFMLNFTTKMGLSVGQSRVEASGASSKKLGYELGALKKRSLMSGRTHERSHGSQIADEEKLVEPLPKHENLVAGKAQYTASVQGAERAPSADGQSANSFHSQDMIIRREVQFDVRYE